MFGDHGITAKDAKIDVGTMIGRKDKIVKQFTGGITMLFKANKVTPFDGFGQLQPGNVVKVKQHDGSEVELKATNVILAAGSDSIELPFAKFDNEAHPRQRRRARLHRRAQAPGRDRRRRDRPGAGQRVEAPRRRSHHPRGPARLPRRRRRRHRQGRGRANSRSRAWTSSSARRSARPRSRQGQDKEVARHLRRRARARRPSSSTSCWSPSAVAPRPRACWPKAPA